MERKYLMVQIENKELADELKEVRWSINAGRRSHWSQLQALRAKHRREIEQLTNEYEEKLEVKQEDFEKAVDVAEQMKAKLIIATSTSGSPTKRPKYA